MIRKNQEKLLMDKGLMKRFGGKRYLVLITVKDFNEITPFRFNRSAFTNMDDWLIVENIDNVKL